MDSLVLDQGTAAIQPAVSPNFQPTDGNENGILEIAKRNTAVQHSSLPPNILDSKSNKTDDHKPTNGGYKDPIFAFLLLIDVISITVVALLYGPKAFLDEAKFINEGYIYAAIICAILSMIVSALGVAILMAIPETTIKVALMLVLVILAIVTIVAFLFDFLLLGLITLLVFLIAFCYIRVVSSR